MIARPQAGEFAPFYQSYIERVPEGNIVQILDDSRTELMKLMQYTPADRWEYRYAEGKWSLKELIVHMIDAERVFAYRALCIARNDKTPLPGFDHNAYVPESRADERMAASIIGEYNAVREASIQLYANLEDDLWTRVGNANGVPVSVRALAFITAGHEMHHLEAIKEHYLDGNFV